MKQKIALFHDSFFIKWGAERMNVLMATILSADLITSVFKKESIDPKTIGFTGKQVEIHPQFQTGMLGFAKMKWAFFSKTQFLKEYTTVFFSNEAITASRNAKHARKIYYAHSISRHLFDQKEQYLKKVRPLIRPFLRIALFILKIMYIQDLARMDLILANSEKNKSFLKNLAPKVQVEVLYPPVNTEEFTPSGKDDEWYFLSYARLAHAKRIDRIIEAFKTIPHQKIRIIYGKNDPQKDEFMKLAEGCDNISFEILEDNAMLPEIVRNSRWVVYVSKNEDFGMITIEAFASWVPVIAVAEGGFLETMIDGETGVLLSPNFSNSDLADAVKKITPEYRKNAQIALLKQAEKFSLENFEKKLKQLLK